MPVLGLLIMNCITFLVSFFARFFSLRVAFLISAWTTLLALAAGLFASMYSCVKGVCGDAISGMASYHPSIGMGLGMAWNSVTVTAFSCYMSVWLLCQIYVIKKKGWDMLLKAG